MSAEIRVNAEILLIINGGHHDIQKWISLGVEDLTSLEFKIGHARKLVRMVKQHLDDTETKPDDHEHGKNDEVKQDEEQKANEPVPIKDKKKKKGRKKKKKKKFKELDDVLAKKKDEIVKDEKERKEDVSNKDEEATAEIITEFLSIEEAKQKSGGNKQKYLNDDDFMTVFGNTKDEFGKMAKWKQTNLKKAQGFF